MDAKLEGRRLADAVRSLYAEWFEIKDECPMEFIGLKMDFDAGDVAITPLSKTSLSFPGSTVSTVRFQHWRSNGHRCKKIGVLYSQLVATVERCRQWAVDLDCHLG